MKELTQAEMEPILLAHGMAEMGFDVDETLVTVVPDPHYEIGGIGLAIDGREAVREMYRRLLADNRNRDIQVDTRVDTVGKNTLMQEARVSFNNSKGERVTGLYLSVVEFDPRRKQILGERIYGDAVWSQLWAESLGGDFADFPGVSRIADKLSTIDAHGAYEYSASRGAVVSRHR
jgi:hypothetical protein